MGQKLFWVKKFFGSKFFFVTFFGGKKNSLGQKKIWVKKICIQNYFCLKKQVGLTQWGGYMTPPPESSRVKIVLGCCWYCCMRSPTKFQTPRIIISGRTRVPGGGGGGGGVK